MYVNDALWTIQYRPAYYAYLLCYAPVLKFLTYYAQCYTHIKDLCLNLTVLLEYIYQNLEYIFSSTLATVAQ